jgi:YD repeat-containing protein
LLGYTLLVFADDSTETYSPTGKLLSTQARNGWMTTLGYDGAGRLVNVRNAFGRELRFTYDTAGRLGELLPPGAVAGSGSGSAASPIRYAYDESASLGVGVPAQSQLTSVTWQDGSVRRYHYEDARWPQALTGITDEAAVRYGTYSYDPQGRVSHTEHAGGADRVDFAYDGNPGEPSRTIVTDYSGSNGSATTRTYTFTDIANVRYPASLTAPCSLCGSTQQASTYDANGNPTKQIAHDGSVTFLAYDAKGRETERATFPSSYQSATTRPALGAATKVISTKWHATFNLPTQVAEPNKTTANTYNAKGLLTGQSWTATTDATGAAKFSAVKTGSTYATGWSYSASNLATTVVERETTFGSTTAVETGRTTFTYNAATGDVIRAKADDQIFDLTRYDAAGVPASIKNNGVELSGYFLAWMSTHQSAAATSAPWQQAVHVQGQAAARTGVRPPTRPDGNRWGWGCGNQDNDHLVPDEWGTANFLPACRAHDVCYGTCKSDKSVCDNNILRDLRAACQTAYGGSSSQRGNLDTCRQVAYGYYLAVSRLGTDSFKKAQEEACKGCGKP